MDFQELCALRRSERRFSPDPPTGEQVRTLLRAALLSPTSKNRRDWRFVVTCDPVKIGEVAAVKDMGAAFVKDAPCLIAVVGSPSRNDCWVEDCSIAASSILYQARDLGLGACWVQMRGRGKSDAKSGGFIPCDGELRRIFSLCEDETVLCVVAVGTPISPKGPKGLSEEDWDKVRSV